MNGLRKGVESVSFGLDYNINDNLPLTKGNLRPMIENVIESIKKEEEIKYKKQRHLLKIQEQITKNFKERLNSYIDRLEYLIP